MEEYVNSNQWIYEPIENNAPNKIVISIEYIIFLLK